MANTGDIVAKLWSLCHVLRDDGITYNEYVTELTYLLFLKMLAETDRENRLPATYRWSELAHREGTGATRLLQTNAARPRRPEEGQRCPSRVDFRRCTD